MYTQDRHSVLRAGTTGLFSEELIASHPVHARDAAHTTRMANNHHGGVRLDFHRVKFCGRRDELDALKVAFERTSVPENPVACSVFLRGDSGSGKSSLIRAFRETLIQDGAVDCLFCRGKFEEGRAAAEPFCAVLQACSSMMRQLLVDDDARDLWRNRFRTELSRQDAVIVQKIIPSLRELLRDDVLGGESQGLTAPIIERNIRSGIKADGAFSSSQVGAESSASFVEFNSTNKTKQSRDRKFFGWFKQKKESKPKKLSLKDLTRPSRGDRSTTMTSNQSIVRHVRSPLFGAGFKRIGKEWSFERLRFSLRSLIRTVSQFAPLVLFLDDLQWAGEDSLMLIQTLICDKMPGRRLLFVGSYRSVGVDHPLKTRILDQPWRHMLKTTLSKRMAQSAQSPWIDMHLNDLEESAVNELLASLFLVQDSQEIRSLAVVVFRKTRGNPFFVLQFLRLLEQRGLVFFSMFSRQWEWRSDLVFVGAEIADHVVDVVKDKIRSMPLLHQQVLSCAACLGVSQFSVQTLLHVLDSTGYKRILHEEKEDPSCLFEHGQHETQILRAVLKAIVGAGFLEERRSTGELKFVHDRIREGAYSLLPHDEDRKSMHLAIGRRLMRLLPSASLGSLIRSAMQSDNYLPDDSEAGILLHAVNQMNLGASLITDAEERRDVAELNFTAAEMSMSRSAFFPAAEFLESGLALLGSSSKAAAWLDDYLLMLKLSIAKARMDYCCGMSKSGIEYADDVIAHAKSFHDKNLAYHTKILCLEQDGKTKEAKELVLSAMEELGVVFPRRNLRLHVGRELLRTKRMLRAYTDEELSNLPATVDPAANLKCELFNRLMDFSHRSAVPDRELVALAVLRIVQMSLSEGRFQLTGLGFVAYGGFMSRLRSFSVAFRFGKIGLHIAKSEDHYLTQSMLLFHGYVSHWQLPCHHSLGPLSRFIKHALDGRATEYIAAYLNFSFCSGRRLDYLANDIRKYTEELEDYKDNKTYEIHAPLFQAVSILTGITPMRQVRLNGEYMNEEDLMRNAMSTMAVHRIYLFKLLLACIFGDFLLADELLPKMALLANTQPPGPILVPWYFLTGLAAFALARSKESRHYRRNYQRKGRTVLRCLRNWKEKGVVNTQHLLLALEAEDLALSSCTPRASSSSSSSLVCPTATKVEDVLKVFDAAIAAASALSKIYYLHDRALANERAAVFCIEQNLMSTASVYMTRAHDLYREWGASAKVIQLQQKYPILLPSSDRSFVTTHLQEQ